MHSSITWFRSLSFWAIFTLIDIHRVDSMPAESSNPEVALGMNELSYPIIFKPPKGDKTFISMIHKGLFIDKTLLIEEILNCKSSVLVFTCPSGWGKTTNLNMLKTFVEMEIHANKSTGRPAENYKLFTKGEYYQNKINIKLQTPLLISNTKYKPIIDRYLGRYAVIYLQIPYAINLIAEKSKGTKMLKKIISEEFEKHRYMVNVYDKVIRDTNASTSEKERATQNRILFENYLLFGKGNLANEDHLIPDSVRFLSEQISQYHGTKVFILFDEFDELIRSEISLLYASFLKRTLNDNIHLEKGILMGVLPMILDDDVNDVGIRDVIHHNFLNTSLYHFFGLTRNEMNLIYNFHNTSTTKQKQIKYWYSGYQPFNRSEDSIFNLWSIRCSFHTGIFMPYWIKIKFFSSIPLNQIFRIPGFSYVFSHLLAGNNYNASWKETEITKHDLMSLKHADWKNQTSIVAALKHMVGSGFLTMKDTYFDREDSLFHTSLRFPNHEVASFFRRKFFENWNLIFESNLLELLKNTSILWENFSLSDNSTSGRLENEILRCFNSLSKCVENVNLEHTDDLIYIIVTTITASKKFHFINSEFRGILLVCESRGIVIEIECDRIPVLKNEINARYLNDVFEEYKQFQEVKDVKFVNCYVREKSIQISSTLHSFNFNESKIS